MRAEEGDQMLVVEYQVMEAHTYGYDHDLAM
jgi:hypothetical protein